MGISQVLSESRCLPSIKFQNLIFYQNSYKDITHLFSPKTILLYFLILLYTAAITSVNLSDYYLQRNKCVHSPYA